MSALVQRRTKALTIAALLLSSTLAIGASANAAVESGRHTPTEFQIPAEGLADALSKFGVQTGMQVLYPPELARGRKSRALSGRHTVEAALKQLLAGSGLMWSYVNDTTIVLKSGSGTSQEMNPADQMRVADNTAVTKPSGSASSEDNAENQKNSITVRDSRDTRRPFSDRNLDLPRTENDAQAYYIFDAQTLQD